MLGIIGLLFDWLCGEDTSAADEYEALLAELRARRFEAMQRARRG